MKPTIQFSIVCILLLFVGYPMRGFSVGPDQPKDAIDQWHFRNATALNKVRFVGGRFIGLGANGTLLTSADGTTWTPRATGTTASLTGAAYGAVLGFPNGLFVAVGSGAVLTSVDSTNWTLTAALGQQLNDVAWKQDRFVITASADSFSQYNAFYSMNGTSWTGRTFTNAPFYPIHSLAIATSGDFSTDYFVTGLGSLGTELWRSIDGITWTRAVGGGSTVHGIARGNNRMFTVGYEGWPRMSTQPLLSRSWTSSQSSAIYSGPNPQPLSVGIDIAYGNGLFLVARGPDTNNFLTTTDGSDWARRTALAGAKIDSFAYGNGTFVAACSGGTLPVGIYQSTPVATPFISLSAQTNAASLSMNISGEVGRAYRLQTSEDLQTWVDLSNYTSTSPVQPMSVPRNPGTNHLFYQVVSP